MSQELASLLRSIKLDGGKVEKRCSWKLRSSTIFNSQKFISPRVGTYLSN